MLLQFIAYGRISTIKNFAKKKRLKKFVNLISEQSLYDQPLTQRSVSQILTSKFDFIVIDFLVKISNGEIIEEKVILLPQDFLDGIKHIMSR